MSESTEFEVVPAAGEVEETPERNPRNEIMARIAARREEQIATENAQAATYDREATEAGLNFATDEPESPPVAAAPIPAPVVSRAPAPAAAPAETPQVRFVEVDGHQYAVTREQEDALLRMGMMANTALHQYQAQPTSFAPPPAAAPEPPKPIIDPESIRETVRRLQYSGEDDAAEALTNLISNVVARVPQQQIDQNAIVARAVAEARGQAQLAVDTETIRDEFADIFAHPMRQSLATASVEAIRQRNIATGQRMSDLDIYREAGNMVRDAMNLPQPGSAPAAQPTAAVASPRANVIERKRNAPRATQPIDLRSAAPAAPRAPTTAEIIDQMRKQRGQPSLQ